MEKARYPSCQITVVTASGRGSETRTISLRLADIEITNGRISLSGVLGTRPSRVTIRECHQSADIEWASVSKVKKAARK